MYLCAGNYLCVYSSIGFGVAFTHKSDDSSFGELMSQNGEAGLILTGVSGM